MTRKPKKTIRTSRLAIEHRNFIKSRGETDAIVLQRIFSDLKKFDFYNRHDLIRKAAEHPDLPKTLLPVYGKERGFHNIINIGECISRTSYPHWLLGIFHRHRDLLTTFLQLKEKISAQILKGDASGALQSLAAVSQISESWWGIELAIHVNKEMLNNDTKGYIKQLQEMHPHLNFSGKTRDLLLLSESSTAQLYIDTVLGRLKEYKSSTVDGAARSGAAESCNR